MSAPPINSGLQGVLAAAITPRGKSGDLNFGAIFEVIDYLSAARVGGIALFTAWGEYPALSLEERARVTYLAVKRSRVPLLAGVGSATFDHSLELAREARSAGVAAILLPPPVFYRCEPDDLREFYLQFAAQLGSGTAVLISGEIPAGTASQLLESGGFAGIEVASGPMDRLQALHDGTTGRAVLSGDDCLLVQARSAGFGVLSACACAAPELTIALNGAICAGDTAAISRLEEKRQELLSWFERFPAPVGLKTAVAVRGIETGPLPVPLSAGKHQSLEEFREWFKGWLPGTRKLASHA